MLTHKNISGTEKGRNKLNVSKICLYISQFSTKKIEFFGNKEKKPAENKIKPLKET